MSTNSMNTPEASELYLQLGQCVKDVQENVAAESGARVATHAHAGKEWFGYGGPGQILFQQNQRFGLSGHLRIGQRRLEDCCGAGRERRHRRYCRTADCASRACSRSRSAVAAIIVKIFFDAATKELCSRWKAELPATA